MEEHTDFDLWLLHRYESAHECALLCTHICIHIHIHRQTHNERTYLKMSNNQEYMFSVFKIKNKIIRWAR